MKSLNLRKSAVAGQFYPASATSLRQQIESFIDKKTDKAEAIACVMPHAGYMYSGKVAAETACRIKIKEKIILLGPNHTGYGVPFSIMTSGAWQTPLGEVNIDEGLAQDILAHSQCLEEDILAHTYEHSLEVELPFLQYFKSDFQMVPIVILSDELKQLKKLGEDIAFVIKESNLKESTLIVASSDMTHYEAQTQAKAKDEQAIEAILNLDADKLMEKVRKLNITMCGYAPTIVAISAAKSLGATKAELVRYQTSGDVTGDTDSVVGYAGIIIS